MRSVSNATVFLSNAERRFRPKVRTLYFYFFYILYSMANIGGVPADVQAVFAMLDMDGNNSIDFQEFNNLIVSLIQHPSTNIAQNAAGNWQGIYNAGHLHELIGGLLPGFPIQNPGQLNLQEFNQALGNFLNHIGTIPPNTQFDLNGGGVIAGGPLTHQFKNLLNALANGTMWINPAPGMVAPVGNAKVDEDGDGDGGMNDPGNWPWQGGEPVNLDVQQVLLDGIGGVPAAPPQQPPQQPQQPPPPAPAPVEPVEPNSINLNANGHDIMGADLNKKITTFIQESFDDDERPLVMKVLDSVTLNEANAKYYLYTLSDFHSMSGGEEMDDVTVYPCLEANGLRFTEARQPNVNSDRPLLAMNKFIARRFNVEKNQFNAVVNAFGPGEAIYIIFANQFGETVPSIASLPFHFAMGADHCGGGVEPEQIWSVIQGAPVNGPAAQNTGGRRKKRKRRRRRTNKKKSKSKAKKRSRRIYHRRKKKTIKKNKSKLRKRKRTRKH
jgi:hypothetical protein